MASKQTKGRKTEKGAPPEQRRPISDSLGRNAREMAMAQALVDNAPFGICVTDLERKVMEINPAVTRMTGYSESELIGRPVSTLYPPDSANSHLDVDSLKQAGHQTKMLRLVGKEGKELPVQADYVFTHRIGDRGAIIENYTDQTDRLRLDQLKNEFVFVAAHELRNPVTAIKLLLDIVFEDRRLVIDPILRGYLLKIQDANEQLAQLVDDLLEVSRTEVGKLKIQVSPQNITEHVLNLLGEMRPTAVTKGVTLRYAPSPDTPEVMADSMKLKEILTNLLSNAIKYNVSGGSVTINHELRGDMLYTTIEDTGIGIKPEEQKRLFEKFWRSEDNAVRAQTGTGLGLFIVRELVRRMGGDIEAESEPGKGTKFTFSLPVAP